MYTRAPTGPGFPSSILYLVVLAMACFSHERNMLWSESQQQHKGTLERVLKWVAGEV